MISRIFSPRSPTDADFSGEKSGKRQTEQHTASGYLLRDRHTGRTVGAVAVGISRASVPLPPSSFALHGCRGQSAPAAADEGREQLLITWRGSVGESNRAKEGRSRETDAEAEVKSGCWRAAGAVARAARVPVTNASSDQRSSAPSHKR